MTYFRKIIHFKRYSSLLNQNFPITLTSAPEAPGISSAIFRRLIPLVRFILREWIFRMSRRAYWNQNSIESTIQYSWWTFQHLFIGESLLQEANEKLPHSYLFIWRWKFNFSINAARTKQGWIQDVYAIGCHNYLQKDSFELNIHPIPLPSLKSVSFELSITSLSYITNLLYPNSFYPSPLFYFYWWHNFILIYAII